MTGTLKLPALEILLRMSPLAALQCLAYAAASGELSRFSSFLAEGYLSPWYSLALAGNGLIAFLLNITSFQTNKVAGALTITICANLKQCLTVLIGIFLFHTHVGPTNGLGMLVALSGASWYSKVEVQNKSRK